VPQLQGGALLQVPSHGVMRVAAPAGPQAYAVAHGWPQQAQPGQQHPLMVALGAGAVPLAAGPPQQAAHQQQGIPLLGGGGSPLHVAPATSSPTRLQL
jgi:hypothetical protein